jgi:hypothetical protein
MSQCGTFAVIGSAGGAIDMFNMQSGLHRQSFPPRLPKSRNAKLHSVDHSASKHTKAVTGLMVDNLNRTVISCSLDGKVKVCSSSISLSWLFSLTKALEILVLGSSQRHLDRRAGLVPHGSDHGASLQQNQRAGCI